MTAPAMFDNGMANGLPGSPGAISALLQKLMAGPMTPGGGPTPPAANGPQQPGPAPAGPQPNLPMLSGPGGLLMNPPASPAPAAAPQGGGSMMDRIHNWLEDKLVGNAPAGYDGLLTPDEIKSARPGIMSALIGQPGAENPQARFRDNLNNIVAMKGLATQMQENRRILQARQNMQTLFPALPNETMDQTRQRLGQMYEYAISHGDTDMVKEIGASLRGVMAVPKEDPFKTAPAGSAIFDPKTGQIASTVPLSSKASDFTQYVDTKGNVQVLPKDQTPPPGWRTIPQTTTQIKLDASEANQNGARIDRLSKQFDTNTKPLRDRAALIEQATLTLNQARSSPDPNERHALYSSAIANFIQAADQKAQIRYQLLNYFKQNIDPSFSGQWDVLKNRLLSGKLPDRIMEGMLTHLGNLKTLTSQEIESQRSGLVKRHPELDPELPHADEFFPMTGIGDGAPSSGAAVPGGNVVTVKGKTYKLPH